MSNEPLKELFQLEFAKMVAVISSLFGLQHIEMAEDIVSDTFLTAAEAWQEKGIPPNPTAWLYTVAKRKTIHLFRRRDIFERKSSLLSAQPLNGTTSLTRSTLIFRPNISVTASSGCCLPSVPLPLPAKPRSALRSGFFAALE